MKRILLLTLLLINSVTGALAYEFSFFNNTDMPIAIAIQYTGNDDIPEPLYGQLIKPHQEITFTPGKIKIPDIKWGFCLDNLYYVDNPTTEHRAHNFAKAPWRKIEITWVKEKSITKREKKESRIPKRAPSPATTPEKKKTSAQEKSLQKSLCRDRHFDIIQDAQGKISITSSLND
ncbi:MAG TPA: hypothetical protein VKU36_04520 [Candidatus Babeliales bacterium]|jgi:hypothetical protein|nr:hypothetical protein [Candidatus Babeliales bacterium]